MNGFRIDPYEKVWLMASGVMMILFLVAVGASVFYGFSLPGHAHLEPGGSFEPGIVRREPGRYDVNIRAQIWSFVPSEIRIPAGSVVTFNVSSPDLLHGLVLERTNINLTVLPGHTATISARFNEPGEYRFFCHEYCGLAHHLMFGKVVVEPRS